MTLKIIHKNNTSAGQAPTPSDLDIGEIAVNSADAKLYVEDNDGAIQSFTNDNDAVTVQQFTQAGSGAVQRTVESKLRDVVSVKDFGAVGDGITDNGDAFEAVSNWLDTPEGLACTELQIPEGIYAASKALKNRRGINVVGRGNVTLVPTGTQRAYTVGGSESIPADVVANIVKGTRDVEFDGDPQLKQGDVVFFGSGFSSTATETNRIMLYKEWRMVLKTIPPGILGPNRVVRFDTPARYDHDITKFSSENPTANFKIYKVRAVGGSTKNINIAQDHTTFYNPRPPFNTDYSLQVASAYGHTFERCRTQGSLGFIVSSDLICFRDCYLQGGNSPIGAAKDTGRVSYINCELRGGPDPTGVITQNYSSFQEETPDRIYFQNCDFFGEIKFTNSLDAQPPKWGVIRGGRIFNDKVGLKVEGFYNSDGPAVDVEGVTFYCKGSTTPGTSVKAVVHAVFANSLRVANCNFREMDADAYTVNAASIGTFRFQYYGNRDGGLGLHPSLDNSAVPLSLGKSTLEASGIKFPAIQVKSSNVNMLDDYEEGTFVPALTALGTNFTTVNYRNERAGQYVKIGKYVYIIIRMETATITAGAAAGAVVISGLPFASVGGGTGGQSYGISSFSVAGVSNWVVSPSSASIGNSQSVINLGISAGDVVTGSTNANTITISGFYQTAD